MVVNFWSRCSSIMILMCTYQDALLAQSQSKAIFSYTGTDQTWIVPDGVTKITVKAWGAGGAGGNYVFNDKGGGGGFVTGELTVTPGETLVVMVGEGGKPGAGDGAYGGGGAKVYGLGGRGGGRSAVINSAKMELITAGAGGGGGGVAELFQIGGHGGGGLTGQPDNWELNGGGPGTQTEGGMGGKQGTFGSEAGDLHLGGRALRHDNGFNGSGGSGYFGGGSGSDLGDGAGGGGSSFVPPGGSTIAARSDTAANMSDEDYADSTGYGGAKGMAGKPGRVVIIYEEKPANIFYSKSSGNLHDVLTWGANLDGSGANPTDFGYEKIFNLANRSGSYTMTDNWTVYGTLNNPSGSQLKINGYTLSITSLTGTGNLSGSTTSNLAIIGTNGGSPGNLNFTPGGGSSLKMLTLNRTGSGASATIGSALSIYDVMIVTSGMLNTANKVTLKSNASNTARVAPVGGSINGNVTVERYIPAHRAWRIMSAPVGGTQTINQAWQEGVVSTGSYAPFNKNPNPGYGTHITGGSVPNGFDQNTGGISTSSLKWYSIAANNWVNATNTNTTMVGTKPYFLFVRGDRSIMLADSNVTPTHTVLRANGPLNIGNQMYPVGATGFTAVANPFASPINFASITRTNVKNSFYVWDPKMGGTYGVGAYVNISYNGSGYDVTPASVSPESQYIQSGQGFMVQSTGVAGSITIKESDKSATPAMNVFRKADGTEAPLFAPAKNAQGLRINLQTINDAGTNMLDEVFTSYSRDFSNRIDDMDAVKMPNVLENLAVIRQGQSLMVDRRAPISDNGDTLYLNLTNTTQRSYIMEFNPIDLTDVVSATIEDNYLHTSTVVSTSEKSQVYFQVNADAASASCDRFKVVLSTRKSGINAGILGKPLIKAYPNPIINGTVNLQFENTAAGMYRLELMNSAGQVVLRRNIQHAGGSLIQKLDLERRIPAGVYQLRITGKDTRTLIKLLNK